MIIIKNLKSFYKLIKQILNFKLIEPIYNQSIEQIMQSINIDNFMEWLQNQLDSKYSSKLQSLKKLFIIFFNLCNQIILLYSQMKERLEKYNQKQEYRELTFLLDHSLYVLTKMIENNPKCIDYNFCQKFIKNFQIHLHNLCTYYHSLCHISIINEQAKFQIDKIVQGINKLYVIQNKIKDIFRNNSNISKILAMINDYKKTISSKIQAIKRKSKECKEKEIFLQNFQPLVVQFYDQYLSQAKLIQPKQDYKKNAIKMYFQLKHQLFSTQLTLQNLCKIPLQICQQSKQKKKNFSFTLQQNCTTFSRWLGFLLKTNYSMKNFKKIKFQQMIKSMQIIVKEYPHTNINIIESVEKNLQEIYNLANLIIDVVKELQKIEHCGIIGEINDYKDGLFTNNSKKYVYKIIQYQNAITKYYSLQQQIKKLKVLAQTIVLQQMGVKVNIIFNDQ